MAVASQQELVERIWARDATVWTGADEDRWLGWLDEPKRMLERSAEIVAFAREARTRFETFVLLGMGGSSLAPEVLKRTFGARELHVLDTTHPAMIRQVESSLDLDRTMFVVSSKSGTTLETLSHFEYFWSKVSDGERFIAITDPGSSLEQLANARGMRVFAGEPTIGGRYSALSPFGVVPAALMGIDVERLLVGAETHGGGLPRRGEPRRCDWGCSSVTGGATGGQGVHHGDSGRLRALGRAADRRVNRQAGQRARARPRRTS